MNTLVLERFSYAPDGTFGLLFFPSGESFYTAERPWLGNKKSESCIPEGVYALCKRHSPIVQRTSGGKYIEGWEVTDVPNRDYIMIHPGNFPLKDLEGCIAVGKSFQIIEDRLGVPRNAVGASRTAFNEMMELMEVSDYWDLEIVPKLISYP
jgi:hypothetical protein